MHYLFWVKTDNMMYQSITAEMPLIPRTRIKMMDVIINIYLILLSAQLRFLNFNANIGMSATKRYEKIKVPRSKPIPNHSFEPSMNVR